MAYVQKTYEVQKTYDVLNEIANTEPFKFIREWNKGLEYTSPLFIRKMEEFNKFINAIGAMGEMCGLLRESLIKNGFTREEANHLVSIFLSETLKSSNS